jgi:hypothetical protein
MFNKGYNCEKHTYLPKLKEWTQRPMKYSESKTLMIILQDQVSGMQAHPAQFQQAFYP